MIPINSQQTSLSEVLIYFVNRISWLKNNEKWFTVSHSDSVWYLWSDATKYIYNTFTIHLQQYIYNTFTIHLQQYIYNTFTIHLQYIYNTSTIYLQYIYNTSTMHLQYIYNTSTIHLQYIYNTFTIHLQYIYNTFTLKLLFAASLISKHSSKNFKSRLACSGENMGE